ncbi:hypothetical protein [Nocardioides sp. YIM 152315]|uniref:hypothetical protein n=1 Tax=Nocardioides sp. YIM 152315 TaxID=3031760 RepID=UPI0023DC1AF9|nr:hypothetical protein [Nocardioides sp. YIM 152315]MDF1603597.1 hypothetical protein [Nocardioides sp. YIM 152315]
MGRQTGQATQLDDSSAPAVAAELTLQLVRGEVVEPREHDHRGEGLPPLEAAPEIECRAQRSRHADTVQRHHVRRAQVASPTVDPGHLGRSVPTERARLDRRRAVVLGVDMRIDTVQPRRRAIGDDVVRLQDEGDGSCPKLDRVGHMIRDVHAADDGPDVTAPLRASQR